MRFSRVTEHTVREAERYLRSYRRTPATNRHEAGFRLMALLAIQVSPPPPLTVAPLYSVATVLRAVRERTATSDGDVKPRL